MNIKIYIINIKKRFLVKPGLTGYTQVYLKNNDTWKKNLIMMFGMLKIEVYY